MTHAQWSKTIRCKVNASWNLHQLLPSDLDFFLLLSSIVGIYGSPGQANYAAANMVCFSNQVYLQKERMLTSISI